MSSFHGSGQRAAGHLGILAAAIIGITGTFALIANGWAQGGLAPLAFTDTQARQGRAVYGGNCAGCHGEALEGLDAPPLIGDAFVDRWSELPVGALFDYIMTGMPLDNPGTLSAQRTASIVALIAQRNGMEAGDDALPEDPEALAQMRFAQ